MDDSSIGTATTQTSSDISDTEESLKEENDLLKKSFKEPDAVVEGVIDSAMHARDHKSISAVMLSKIWRIDRNAGERTLEITSKRFSRSDVPSLSIILLTLGY